MLYSLLTCVHSRLVDRACMYHPRAWDLLCRSSAVGAAVVPTKPLRTLKGSPAWQWERCCPAPQCMLNYPHAWHLGDGTVELVVDGRLQRDEV